MLNYQLMKHTNKMISYYTKEIITPPTRRVWRSFKFAPFLFFFPVSKVGLPLMGDTAVQYTERYLRFWAHINTTFKLNF